MDASGYADTAISSGQIYLDGSSGLSVNLSSTFIRQHALLPRVSSLAGNSGPVGQSHQRAVRRAPSSPRAPVHPAGASRATHATGPRTSHYERRRVLGAAKGVLDSSREPESRTPVDRDDHRPAVVRRKYPVIHILLRLYWRLPLRLSSY